MRRLGAGDGSVLRALRLAALLDAPYAFASTHERERDDTDAQWSERATRFAWFVADGAPGGGPAGLIAGADSHEGVPGRRDLLSMWVHPQRRGRGIAGLLVGAVREWAVADGAREIALWVADGNDAAVRAYARAGFTATGHRQPLPSNPAVGEEQWVLLLGAGPAGPA